MMQINHSILPKQHGRIKDTGIRAQHHGGIHDMKRRMLTGKMESRYNNYSDTLFNICFQSNEGLNDLEDKKEQFVDNGEFRYVIFFNLSNWDNVIVQKINISDNLSSIEIPYGTECFCFLRTNLQADEIKQKILGTIYYELFLQIEDNTLYSIIANSNQAPNDISIIPFKYPGLANEFNNIKIINIDFNDLKRTKYIKKDFNWSEAYVGINIEYTDDYTISLLEDGTIKARQANRNGVGRYYMRNNEGFRYILCAVDRCSKWHPGIYEAIINHISSNEENHYYKLLREHCISVINNNYREAEATLKKVRRLI